jgi:hypothetical protein
VPAGQRVASWWGVAAAWWACRAVARRASGQRPGGARFQPGGSAGQQPGGQMGGGPPVFSVCHDMEKAFMG